LAVPCADFVGFEQVRAPLASLKGDQDTETEVVGQASILSSVGLSTTPLKGIKLFAKASKA